MTLSRRTILKSIAATGAAAASPGVFAPAIAQARPLKLGILAPRTGIAASAGISGLRATEWAVERFNAGGGIAGRKSRAGGRGGNEPQGHHRALPEARAAGESRLRSGHRLHRRRPRARPGGGGGARAHHLLGRHHPGRRRGEAAEPEVPVPLHRQRMRSGDVLTARHQALEGQFKRIAGINPDYSYGRNNMAAFIALLRRFNIEHEVVTEQWPKVGTMELTSHVAALRAARAGPDLLVAAVRRPARVHEARRTPPSSPRAPSSCSRPPAGSTRS